jgi:hypothetical protein
MAIRCAVDGDHLRTTANAPSGVFTAMFWFQLVEQPGGYRFLWGIGNDTAGNLESHSLWLSGANAMHLYWPGGSFTAGPGVTLGVWNFVALVGHTAGSQAWTLWVNGGSTAMTSVSGYVDRGVDLGGTRDDTQFVAESRFAAYKHWSAQLTAAEVEAERRSYLPQRWSQLWTAAPLLHTGEVRDWSGQGRDFTVGGTPSTEDGPPILWPRRRLLFRRAAAAPVARMPSRILTQAVHRAASM